MNPKLEPICENIVCGHDNPKATHLLIGKRDGKAIRILLCEKCIKLVRTGWNGTVIQIIKLDVQSEKVVFT